MSVWRKMSIAAFTALTLFCVAWQLLCWFSYQFAEFDCADLPGEDLACITALHRQVLAKAGAGIMVWLLAGWLTFRNWERR